MKKISRFIVLLFLVFPICSIAALGDDDELSFYELEEDLMRTVTIATGVEQSVARAPSVATVITAQDIEAIGARDIDELLETVPGLHVVVSPYSYSPIYTIRGIYSPKFNPQVLMLINGIPITNLYTGQRALWWGGMPVAGIERIEIIRGPGSAIFGADAFAGVINIITKTAKTNKGTEIGSRVGSFKTGDIWVSHGGSYKGFDVSTTLEYITTDGHKEKIEADVQTNFDKTFCESANYCKKASLAPGSVNLQQTGVEARIDVSKDHWQLRTGYQQRYDIGSGAGVALDPFSHHSHDRFNTDLTWHNPKLTETWDVTAQLAYYHSSLETKDQNLYPPGAFMNAYPNGMIIDSSIAESHTRLNVSGFYSGFKKHLIRLGTGYYYGDMYEIRSFTNTGLDGTPLSMEQGLMDITDTINTVLPEVDRKNWHMFIQDMWTLSPNLELTLGLRYDKYSDFGKTINPRGALVWQLRQDFTAKLMYGTAFRPPAIIDLYTRNAPWLQSNPNLDPETIKTWELAFNYRATNLLNFAVNLYQYKWIDGIVPAADIRTGTEGSFRVSNSGLQKGQGIELESRWKMTTKFSLLANYSFVKATDEKINHDSGNYPHHSSYLRTDWLLFPSWHLNAQANFIGKIGRIASDNRPALAGYTTVDLTLRYKNLKKNHWNFAVSVRNLFDAKAHAPSEGPDLTGALDYPDDYPLAGRSFLGEIRYKF